MLVSDGVSIKLYIIKYTYSTHLEEEACAARDGVALRDAEDAEGRLPE